MENSLVQIYRDALTNNLFLRREELNPSNLDHYDSYTITHANENRQVSHYLTTNCAADGYFLDYSFKLADWEMYLSNRPLLPFNENNLT
jgi:hypothetical protein